MSDSDKGGPVENRLVELGRSTWNVFERIAVAAERIATALEKGGTPAGNLPFGRSHAPQAGGATFGPFGKSANEPIAGANMNDLRFYGKAALRSLADPGKARFHAKERILLDAINAEITRQGGEIVVPEGAPPPADEPEPPPDDGGPSDDNVKF